MKLIDKETLIAVWDLEEELDRWRHQHFHGRRDVDADGEYLERTSQLDLARHFANWQRERMMKDAVEGCITAAGGDNGYNVAAFKFDEDHTFTVLLPADKNVKYGDKVKLISIKED